MTIKIATTLVLFNEEDRVATRTQPFVNSAVLTKLQPYHLSHKFRGHSSRVTHKAPRSSTGKNKDFCIVSQWGAGLCYPLPSLPQNFVVLYWELAGTHFLSKIERGIVRVKCVGQELNIVTRPGVVPSPLYHESHTLTVRPQSPLDVNSKTLWACYLFINF